MNVVIIKGCGANIASVVFASERLGVKPILSDDPKIIKNAEKVILPGVGSAKNAMEVLREKKLIDCILQLKQPVLGICLGMQLLFSASEEGDTSCLGIIPGLVKKIPIKAGFAIPHMGWNTVLRLDSGDQMLTGITGGDYCYFVHSFYAPVSNYSLLSTDYVVPITAMVKKDNFYGCQFHPEKSGKVGAKILENFLSIV